MSNIQLITVAATTDGDGDYTTTLHVQSGRLLQMRYVPDGTSPLATGADIDLVGATTGFVYINQDNIGTSAYDMSPRVATSANDGSASLFAAAGEPVEAVAYVCGEPLTFTVSNGGDTKSGTFYFWIG